MSTKILPIPQIPEEIINAINNKNLAIFFGAGVSRLVGCMGWDKLAKEYIELCYNTKDGESLISFREKETLESYTDNKKVITICKKILEDNGKEELFYDKMKELLNGDDDKLKNHNIYHVLFYIGNIFITTNADIIFDNKFTKNNIFFKVKDFEITDFSTPKLFKIHGCINERSSLVFTLEKYIDTYKKPIGFIKYLFEKFVVLFIGYGLSELEVIDYLFTKNEIPLTKKNERRRFMLLPFYSGEDNILKFEEDYFRTLDIHVIPYQKDQKGYNQLYYVLKKWKNDALKNTSRIDASFEIIDKHIKKFNSNSVEEVLQIIKEDYSEKYFFEELSKTHNPLPWLKPLKENHFFDTKNNPEPKPVKDKYVTTPIWGILGFLENCAQKIEQSQDVGSLNLLVEVIDKIVDDLINSEKTRNYITNTSVLRIISFLPAESIKSKHIEFSRKAVKFESFPDSLRRLLNKFIKTEKKKQLIELLEVILDYEIKNEARFAYGKSLKFESIFGYYGFNYAIKGFEKEVAKICGIEAAEVGIKKVNTILIRDASHFNGIYIPTLEGSDIYNSLNRYECQLVYFIRDILKNIEPIKHSNYIQNHLKEEHAIFKRIAVHIISHRFNELKSLFWDWEENPFKITAIKNELFQLLKKNGVSFSEGNFSKIIKWLEEIKIEDYEKSHFKTEKEIDKTLAYRKKGWLSALKETKNKRILSKYADYDKIAPENTEDFAVNFKITTTKSSDSNFISFDDKSNEEIARTLIEYDGSKWEKERFSDSFRDYVYNNIIEVFKNTRPFLKIPKIYQLAIFQAFLKAVNNNLIVDWDRFLNFTNELIISSTFKNDKQEPEKKYSNRIANYIADIIISGSREKNSSYDKEITDRIEKILLELNDVIESDIADNNRIAESTHNSSKGNILKAMIVYSKKYAQLFQKKDSDVKWPKAIRTDFSNRISRENNTSCEFSFIIGKHLNDLYYLDSKWVTNNINNIFLKKNETHWLNTFTGYLHSERIYSSTFKLLKKHNHYRKAIQTDFPIDYLKEYLVEHICLAFLNNYEKQDAPSSLMKLLLKERKIEYLLPIIDFFEEPANTNIEKIKYLWKKLIEIAKEDEKNLKNKRILAALSKWIITVDVIDNGVFEWLKLSAKYINIDNNISMFIKRLAIHSEKTPKLVGELLIVVLDAEIYPTDRDCDKNDIKKIVEDLFLKNEPTLAKRICKSYSRVGYNFLMEISKRYKNEK